MNNALTRRALTLATLLIAACSSSPDPAGSGGSGGGGGAPMVVVTPTPAPEGAPWATLDEWHLFADARALTLADGVIPYDVNAPLFSDYTVKRRFVWLPKGTKIGWQDTDRWKFPVGAILIKTFAYPIDARDPSKGQRLLETRLLVHESDPAGWISHTYEWDAEQTKATRKVAGDTIDMTWIDEAGKTRTNAYEVPNTNVCQECHGKAGITGSLGGRTRQWNRTYDYGKGPENQIDHLVTLGLLDVAPPAAAQRQTLLDPFGTGDVGERGRAYLDVNCSHCHGVVGLAKGTALRLDYDHTDLLKGDPTDYGVCKAPASSGAGGTCGLSFDLVPGHSDQSILICRTDSLEAKVTMPPVGHKLIHDEGVALLKAWIDAMPEHLCQ
jgi:uncharacterized repeat protein (TIGR03806 family)